MEKEKLDYEALYNASNQRYLSLSDSVTKMLREINELKEQNRLVESKNKSLLMSSRTSDTVISQNLNDTNKTINQMGEEINRLRNLCKKNNINVD